MKQIVQLLQISDQASTLLNRPTVQKLITSSASSMLQVSLVKHEKIKARVETYAFYSNILLQKFQ